MFQGAPTIGYFVIFEGGVFQLARTSEVLEFMCV